MTFVDADLFLVIVAIITTKSKSRSVISVLKYLDRRA